MIEWLKATFVHMQAKLGQNNLLRMTRWHFLQTQTSKCKPSRSEVEHATSRSRRLTTILDIYEWTRSHTRTRRFRDEFGSSGVTDGSGVIISNMLNEIIYISLSGTSRAYYVIVSAPRGFLKDLVIICWAVAILQSLQARYLYMYHPTWCLYLLKSTSVVSI